MREVVVKALTADRRNLSLRSLLFVVVVIDRMFTQRFR
jgi:hypothetical protein